MNNLATFLSFATAVLMLLDFSFAAILAGGISMLIVLIQYAFEKTSEGIED